MTSPPRPRVDTRPARRRRQGAASAANRRILEQAAHASHDRVTRPREVLAHRRHVVPADDAERARAERAEVAREGDDGRRALDLGRGWTSRPPAGDVDAVARETLEDVWRYGVVGLGAGRGRARVEAPGGGETVEVLGGDETLGRAVQADEQDVHSIHGHDDLLLHEDPGRPEE